MYACMYVGIVYVHVHTHVHFLNRKGVWCACKVCILSVLPSSSVEAIAASAHVITGSISCGAQYHFHMETQVRCVEALYTCAHADFVGCI